ncbi:MAG: hypothetical protein IPM16_03660 [Chloroflexi bacterium]|nr:hypothetical protein [Chloroflexota bacterium]
MTPYDDPSPDPYPEPAYDDSYDEPYDEPYDQPDATAEPEPAYRQYRSTTGDPTFGFLLALAVSIGLAPLIGTGDPALRYTLSWGVLALFGVTAWLLGNLKPIGREHPENIVWGVGFGLLIGVPVLLFGSGLLGGAVRRMFGTMTAGELLAFLIFVMPLAETLFFRGILHGSRAFWMVAIMSAFWSFILYLPLLDIAAFPLVAVIITLMLVLLNIMYGYVRTRNGMAAAWIAQIVANIVVFFVPYLVS